MKPETNSEVVAALEHALEFIHSARSRFPKSIRHRDAWQLETACAAVGRALHNAKVDLAASAPVAATRLDYRTGQYVPTINGVDTSPTSFDESQALNTAQQQAAQ